MFRVLLLTLGIYLVTLVSQCHAQACSMTNPCADQLGQGAPFAEPDQLSSASTTWSITLNVDIATITYNWLELERRTYNGKITGPTWTVKRGDTVTVTLNNLLSDVGNNLNVPLNQQNYPNSTNLHTHGLHISSADPQDNVLKHIEPGQTYPYVYQIHADNPPGTYWYHAHLHGSTMFQVQSGLSGMIIVQDNVADMPTELAAVSCPDNCDKDIQLLFQPILIYNGNRGFGELQEDISDNINFRHDSYTVTGGGSLTDWLAANVNHYTTNGLLQPTLDMVTGQMYRFRMVNAGGDATLEVYITDSNNVVTTNCDIREIGIDSIYLDAPRTIHDGQSFMTPAGRVDWLVKCNVAGTYKLRSFPDARHRLSIGGMTRFEGDLMTLNVAGTAVSPTQAFPTTLPTKPSFLNDLRTTAQADIGGRFVVELNPSTTLNRERWSGGDNYRYKMTVGTIQEWHLLNTDTGASHPLHIHVNHYQVISYNNYTGGLATGTGQNWELVDIDDQTTSCVYQRAGFTAARRRRSTEESSPRRVKRQGPGGATDPLQFWGHETRFAADAGNTLGYSRLGDWRDVLLVPPLANITIRFLAHEHIGDVIIHCHILAHEDSGMMMITSVVAAGQSTAANVTSGNAYPGTCRSCDRHPFNNATRLCDAAGVPEASQAAIIISTIIAVIAMKAT